MLFRTSSPTSFFDIILPDISGLQAFKEFSKLDAKLPIVFITGGGVSDTAIEAMKLGAFDYLVKPLDLSQVRALAEQALRIRRLMTSPVGFADHLTPEDGSEAIVGESSKMQAVYKAIGRVAPQDVTVLVQGESGTGKELVARAIYHHSKRAGGPFMAVNCAAIPEPLLESELFGHEKGSYTGADRRRIGRFEQCTGGTIFLDEIGDMPLVLQSKILRLLQQQQFERVGGSETIQVDVRIIAATNRVLEEMVAEETFREDLYYRLKGFSIHLPPLRERGDDLPLLMKRLLARFNRELGVEIEGVSPDALETLRAYSWPGNVRELENVLKQAMVQSPGPFIIRDFLPKLSASSEKGATVKPARASEAAANAAPASEAGAALAGETTSSPPNEELAAFVERRMADCPENLYAETLEFMERALLGRVLRHAHGNQSQAARMLGITRGSLRNKIRALDISIEQVVSVGGDASENEDEAD
jgi:DNA-binding NtrC family response regulator